MNQIIPSNYETKELLRFAEWLKNSPNHSNVAVLLIREKLNILDNVALIINKNGCIINNLKNPCNDHKCKYCNLVHEMNKLIMKFRGIEAKQ